MQGRNEVRFNAATMMRIVQHYFDAVLFRGSDILVTGIEQLTVEQCPTFVVAVSPKPKTESDLVKKTLPR